ncbi:hypothetical protein EVAR_85017_1 [Eumeta japonica]|uniref:Uncharacterized protein n=1 Tax=Eumeta variegata TaxID=151549 RepID=A0A4C1WBA6_EUMVA|nr:hypothetical protein EVAR_85017_1 [Eumeta japonica]
MAHGASDRITLDSFGAGTRRSRRRARRATLPAVAFCERVRLRLVRSGARVRLLRLGMCDSKVRPRVPARSRAARLGRTAHDRVSTVSIYLAVHSRATRVACRALFHRNVT